MRNITLSLIIIVIALVSIGLGWAIRDYTTEDGKPDGAGNWIKSSGNEAHVDWDTVDGQVYDCIILEDGVWTWAMFPDCDEEDK